MNIVRATLTDASCSGGGAPTMTTVPRLRTAWSPASTSVAEPTASNATSAPIPVISIVRPTTSVSSGSITSVAPKRMASSRRDPEGSDTTMRAAPAIAAPCTMEMPIPPAPMTRTWSPGCTAAVLIAAPTPVCTAQPITQATSSGTSTGMATAPEAAMMTSSAQAPRPRPRYTTSDRPPAPEPTGRERWVVPSGNIGMAMEIDPVHTDGSPRRQYSHRPHAGFGLSTT